MSISINFDNVNVMKKQDYYIFYRKEEQRFSDAFVIDEVFDRKVYDVYQTYVKPKTVIDLGCNIGIFSLKVLSDFKDCNVWSFEIDRNNFDYEQYNKMLNNVNTRWKTYFFGVGRKTGIRTYVNPYKRGMVAYQEGGVVKTKIVNTFFNPGGYSLKEVAKNDSSVDTAVKPFSDTTFVVDFKTILKLTGQKEIDLCKVDIERAEFEVFPNLPREVIRKVKAYVMEIHVIDDADTVLYDKLVNHFIACGFLMVADQKVSQDRNVDNLSVACFVRDDVL